MTFSYGAEIFLHPLVQLTGDHHICSFEFFESEHEKLKEEFGNIFVMVFTLKY